MNYADVVRLWVPFVLTCTWYYNSYCPILHASIQDVSIFGIHCPRAWMDSPGRQLIVAGTSGARVLLMTGWMVTAFDHFVVVICRVRMMCSLINLCYKSLKCYVPSFPY